MPTGHGVYLPREPAELSVRPPPEMLNVTMPRRTVSAAPRRLAPHDSRERRTRSRRACLAHCVAALAVAAGLVTAPAFADQCLRSPDPVAENDAWRVTATFQAGRWRYTLFDKKTGEPVRTKPLQGIEKHAHLELHVGDDGGFAVLDPDAEHRSIDRLLVYDAAGVLRASLGIRDILTAREQAGVQRSVSHIHWLAGPPKTRTYAQVLPDRRGVRLTTLAGRQVLVSLADGSITADPEAPAAKPADRPAGRATLDAIAAAKAAASGENRLDLDSLTTLDAAAAKALAGFKGQYLMLDGLTTLSAEAAKALAEYKGDWLELNGLTALSAEAAAALAQFKGSLSLNGLTTLDIETAEALARSKCRDLGLSGLKAIAEDTAQALARFKGSSLSLFGLVTPPAATAEPLVAFSSVVSVLLQNLREERTMTLDRVRLLRACTRRLAEQGLQTEPVRLDGLTALDTPDAVEIARLLAGAEVPLMLRNLSRASPKTLSALLETDAVEIPLIEDLEIIKEPDGSPTEDFVVPERVLERQRRQSKIE